MQSILRDGEPRHQMRMLMYLQDRKHAEQIYPLPAHWTSSVFLLFAHELTERRAASQRISMSTSVPARKRESSVR
jgi:hypothetical protein